MTDDTMQNDDSKRAAEALENHSYEDENLQNTALAKQLRGGEKVVVHRAVVDAASRTRHLAKLIRLTRERGEASIFLYAGISEQDILDVDEALTKLEAPGDG